MLALVTLNLKWATRNELQAAATASLQGARAAARSPTPRRPRRSARRLAFHHHDHDGAGGKVGCNQPTFNRLQPTFPLSCARTGASTP
eukprot:1282984-Rhodomonas_salina.2